MPSFRKLITDLTPLFLIEVEIKKIEDRSKKKDEQIIKKYNQATNLQIEKIRRRNDLYIHFQKKKETPLQPDNIPKFLQASRELETNKHISLLSQKRVYHLNFVETEKALQAVNKEYKVFLKNRRQQSTILRARIQELTNNIDDTLRNYASLSEQKLEKALTEPKINENTKSINLIPFLSQKIDTLFQSQIGELNLGRDQLIKMKSIQNNVLGKIQFLIDLLKQKQQQKKIIDAQNDEQIQQYQKKREIALAKAIQARQKQKQALQLMQMMKQEQKRYLKNLYNQKKKIEFYKTQVTQYRNEITRINDLIAWHREKEQKHFEKLAKLPFDERQKIEVLIARDREKDMFILEKKKEQKELLKQKKFFQTLEKQAIKRQKIRKGELPQQQDEPLEPFQTKTLLQSYLQQKQRKDDELSNLLEQTRQRVRRQDRQKQQQTKNAKLNQTNK